MAGEHGMNGNTGAIVRSLIGAAIAAIVAYYTAQIQTENRLTTTDGQVIAIRQLEDAHFQEVQRSLARIERAIERIEANGVDRRTGEPLSIQRQFDK